MDPDMIVVSGIATETPVAMVTSALDNLRLPYVMLHQRQFMNSGFDLHMVNGAVQGQFFVDGTSIDCAEVSGIYTRLMDWRILPEAKDAGEAAQQQCRQWHDSLNTWIEIAPGCVMNRAAASASNSSKPFQAQLIQQAGFNVPETLVTNDPDLVREFRARHGRVIYKSISGIRSIVRYLDDDAIDRLDLVRWCPVQFQRYIPGVNVRVHTVSGEVIATRIETDRVDYRYAHRDGGEAVLTPWTLPDEIAQRCLALSARLGLNLAGLDLLFADDGDVYCFEVNPSPAFSYFEHESGQQISRSIALALARGQQC
jgi:hypothetical protein